MHRIALAVPLLLAACAAETPHGAPVHGATPGHMCKADNVEQFIGQPGTSETGSAILRSTNAAVLRWAPPGSLLTMDYRFDRVTVRLGPDYSVSQVSCG